MKVRKCMNINICDIRKDWSAKIFNKIKSWRYFWILPQSDMLANACWIVGISNLIHFNPSNLKPFWHIFTIYTIKMSLTHIFLAKINKISPLGVCYWQDGQHFLAICLSGHILTQKLLQMVYKTDPLWKLWCIIAC